MISQTKNPLDVKNSQSRSEIDIKNSDVHSYVTGQEAWFVAMGVNSLAQTIMNLDDMINKTASQFPVGTNASFTYNDPNKTGRGEACMNIICVNMVAGINPTSGEDVDGKIVIDGVTALNQNDDDPISQMVDMLTAATKGEAPVFVSSAGGVCITNNVDGIFGLDATGNPVAPAVECLFGDFLQISYKGLGILLEYN